MPTGWTRVGTPEDLRELLDRPDDFRRAVQKRVAGAGAGLHDVYFQQRGGPAYVLITIPGFADDAQPIVARLEEELGSQVALLFTAEELSTDAGSAY